MVNLLLRSLPFKPHGIHSHLTPILPSPRPKSMAEEPSSRALRQEKEVEEEEEEEEEEEDDDDDEEEDEEEEEEEEEEEAEATVAPPTSSSTNIYPESWLQLGLGPSPPPRPPPAPSPAGSRPAALQLFAEMPLQPAPSGPAQIATPEGGFLRLMPWPAGPPESADPNRIAGSSSSGGAWQATPSPTADTARSDFRVVIPPPRPQAGVWVVLQAAENQGREPSLPQIPRSYFRIKDGRMPVRLLIKYIAEKLGLEDESQVELTCRGQRLPPFLTLQQVRDDVWRPRETVVSSQQPDSSASSQLMTLHYSRSL